MVECFLGGNQFFWVIGSMVENEPLSKKFRAIIFIKWLLGLVIEKLGNQKN
jgi:hypothetical protein